VQVRFNKSLSFRWGIFLKNPAQTRYSRRKMSKLFSPITIRGEEIPNRVFVAPMCQYSSETEDGRCSGCHTVHYGTRAVGGAGPVMLEASSVRPGGRVTPWDLGLWNESHVEAMGPVVDAIVANGATPAIQLAHAGRKASHTKPWDCGKMLPASEGMGDHRAKPDQLPRRLGCPSGNDSGRHRGSGRRFRKIRQVGGEGRNEGH
jgi:2,4-dienoyl-CoA reductase-like NADH-dependent reductase (Old Yellow Enzyme family)